MTAEPALLAAINRIQAIDNHAHAAPILAPGEKDPEFEVADSIPPDTLPVRLRPSSAYVEAWRRLYGYRRDTFDHPHDDELREAKRRTMAEKGMGYPAWVLDQLGIETMLVNRFQLGRGQTAPRFLWVWPANPLLFPLDNESAKKDNPQREADFTNDEASLKRFLDELRLPQLPETLDAYLTEVVEPLLERRKREGAVAVKFYAAYQRSLDFGDASPAVAARVYARHVRGGVPDAAEYKALQDYLFRRIALHCGHVGLVVHVHVGLGAGGWFYSSGASPFLLEPVLNDPRLRGTRFVLIHGGLPLAAATRALLGKPNVYADFSSHGFLTSVREMSDVIRAWLEAWPEKVLFGTDAYPLTTMLGWEEIGWLTTNSARQALALALTGMMNDGEITRDRALELARMVLRENAIGLYGLPRTPSKR